MMPFMCEGFGLRPSLPSFPKIRDARPSLKFQYGDACKPRLIAPTKAMNFQEAAHSRRQGASLRPQERGLGLG